MSRPRLVLIDGSSYLYRAFHALPPLTNAAGEPTGALFGVVNMLRSIIKDQPDYVAFVADASGPTFRDDMYADYKATRDAMPDDMRSQIEPMLAIVQALGFTIIRESGVEADDVIGTLALAAAADGMDVSISTGDKDFAQLVSPQITLVNTMTGVTLDEAAVQEKFGVPPNRIIDFLSLTGDSVDNIPGVDKCGPKTAAKWLGQYDTLANLMTNADKIGGKVGENLRAALGHLSLSRQLVTIKTDVDLPVAHTDLVLRGRDIDSLRPLYERYGFTAAIKELDGNVPTPKASAIPKQAARVVAPAPTGAADVDPALLGDGDYELVTTHAHLDTWLEKLRNAELISFDVETTGLDPMLAEIVGISFAFEPKHAAYVPLTHDYPGAPKQLDRDMVLAAIKPILEDAAKPKLGQHGKYDINLLSQYGITVNGYAQDSMLESYVLNSTATRHDMDSLAQRYLGIKPVAYEEVCGKGAKQISFSQVDLETATRYAAEDSDITLRLHHALNAKLEAVPTLLNVYASIEIPLVPVLARMEQCGILIDVPALRLQSQQLGKRMVELTAQAHGLAGHPFSLDSPKQLQAILFDELKLPAKLKTPKGQPSTNEEALDAISDLHELPQVILDYRGMAKLRSTYTEKLADTVNPRTGRVHTSYHQAVAATGRLSSSDPNLQNIPIRTEEGRRIRQAFVAPDGWKIVAADYSQIELRIMAHLSGDAGLLSAFHGNQDVHRATAAEVFGVPLDDVDLSQRRAAKAINFGLMYGMGPFGLARQLNVSRGEAQDYIARYFQRYPGVRDFMDRIREQAHRDGYVETLFGRRLYLDYIDSRNQAQRAGAERAAINAPMQGTAADIIKRAMLSVDDWLQGREADARMLLQVHDELVFEVRFDAVGEIVDGIRERMTAAASLDVPLVVDIGIGDNWDEAH